MSRSKHTNLNCPKLLTILSLTAVITLSACGNNGNSSNNMNSNSYGNDGYLGISNSNPLLPNRNGQFINYNDDSKFARNQLSKVEGIAHSNLLISGHNLYANIKPKPGYNETRVLEKAISTLTFNMPRYKVHVDLLP